MLLRMLLRPPLTQPLLSSFSFSTSRLIHCSMSGDNELPPPPSSPKKNVIRYNLYRGHPNIDCLPQSEMQAIMSSLLNDNQDSWKKYLNYGANAGDERLLSALRSFLLKRTADDDLGEVTPCDDSTTSNFFITSGVSHGLELLCSTSTNHGDEVWIERPTYFLCTQIFKSNGLSVKSLPMSTPGKIDTDRLIDMVERDGVSPPKMIYIIPSYHNPTGLSMSVEERKKLASFAVRNGVLLVCDEEYHLLDFERGSYSNPRPAGMVRFNTHTQATGGDEIDNNQGCCISVSSFTKIFAPGVRLGWVEAPPFIIERLSNYGYIDSQGGNAPFMGSIMANAIEMGLLDSYLDKLRIEYKERYGLVCGILQQEPRLSILSIDEPRGGGYFIWVRFPPTVNADEFLTYSIENYGVRFMAGTKTNPFPNDEDDIGTAIKSCARICFADLNREDLRKGTETFVEAFQSYITTIE
ncbi:PLP-dependent aminotransferase family protein [Skeletonema marinoi]|uniref:PLP-dependent aminotransferase family protein n=1 Tax=Skeletonema marinoi TaxID=267567 RepID=A0AAD8Y7C0_9STRA|nr:PLP-dependent aminotransferase family protein [Skeletonema marinoi]